uniref:Uncharacterized protein n=1 Tax=Caulerpa lentillifera TaxID=148947 RepID=A0A2Z2QKH8_9CHLO|nr:hypothetical protein [Caulerpa lentillifera]AST24244.1 hypothetical protein [Caulerpa lentillifera]QKS32245.1 hypothetical protein [Caulerpa lentillifera]
MPTEYGRFHKPSTLYPLLMRWLFLYDTLSLSASAIPWPLLRSSPRWFAFGGSLGQERPKTLTNVPGLLMKPSAFGKSEKSAARFPFPGARFAGARGNPNLLLVG